MPAPIARHAAVAHEQQQVEVVRPISNEAGLFHPVLPVDSGGSATIAVVVVRDAARSYPHRMWEYKTLKLPNTDSPFTTAAVLGNVDQLLKSAGSSGWELVTATPLTNYTGTTSEVLLFFKRPSSPS